MSKYTTHQLLKKTRICKKHFKRNSPILEGRPQKLGICEKFTVFSPKKPNSGNRKVAKLSIKMFNQKTHNFYFTKEYYKRKVWVYLRGQQPNVSIYSQILFQGKGVKDLIGVRYRGIRGNRGFEGQLDRKNSRSKYGAKKNN